MSTIKISAVFDGTDAALFLKLKHRFENNHGRTLSNNRILQLCLPIVEMFYTEKEEEIDEN